MQGLKKIALISTGGTIEKTYNPLSGVLNNEVSVLDLMLAQLSLRGVQLTRVALMNKDSLHMNQQDHELIAMTVEVLLKSLVLGKQIKNAGPLTWLTRPGILSKKCTGIITMEFLVPFIMATSFGWLEVIGCLALKSLSHTYI